MPEESEKNNTASFRINAKVFAADVGPAPSAVQLDNFISAI